MKSRLMLVVVALMMVMEHAAFSQRPPSPREIVSDDRTPSSATGEIMDMQHQKLVVLKRMLSECGPNALSQSEEIRLTCDVARSDYAIEFGSDSSLDDLINSVDLTSELLRSDAASNRKN